MSISALVAVGPINRLSYQYNSKLVLENFVHYFDRVYVISSSRETSSLPISSNKIIFISDETSWFCCDEDGKEVLDMEKISNNGSRIMELSHEKGDDVAIGLCINQYIDHVNADKMRNYCDLIKKNNQPFGYLYKAYQIRDSITFPDTRLPWVINLKHKEFKNIRFAADSIYFKDEHIRIKSGIFKDAPFYITDIYGEMTEKDFYERWEYYLKNLREYVGDSKAQDSWSYWLHYYSRKANTKVLNPRANLTEWGRKVLDNIPPDALVHKIEISRKKQYLRFLSTSLTNLFTKKA